MSMYRQGDVLLVKVDEAHIEKAELVSKQQSIVLARGEATGHVHLAESVEAGEELELLQRNRDQYLRVPGMFIVRHQEHASLQIPKGIYQVIRQQEYSDFDILTIMD